MIENLKITERGGKMASKSFAQTKKTITAAWWQVSRACDLATYVGVQYDAQRGRENAIEFATKGEREHRRMGARFTDGRAQYRGSHELAAQLIFVQHVCKVLRGEVKPEPGLSWQDFAGYRTDVALAYACGSAMLKAAKVRLSSPKDRPHCQHRRESQKRLRATIKALVAHPVKDLDYATDIAVREG